MYIPLRNSHSLGYGVRIEDRPSVPVALPFVGVTRYSVGVLLQGKIRAESRNALKCRSNWRAQVRVAQTPLLGLRLVGFARASSLLRSDASRALRR